MTVTDEMVRALGDVLVGRVNAPEQEIYRAARDGLTAALAVATRPLPAPKREG